jgi:hypothetical protein
VDRFERVGALAHRHVCACERGALDSQWLRRVSLGESLGADANITVSIRAINGSGGFAPREGSDIAIGYHRRFTDGDEMFVDFGTPAAYSTLHRLIVRYVVHAGGGAG